MEDLMDVEKLKVVIEVLGQVVLGLVVIATALARVLGGGKYQDDVAGVRGKVLKAVQFLPTVGINPRTKHLEEQLKEMEAIVKEVSTSSGNPS